MLRPFQVNVGSFLTLGQDILPTAKVAELCRSIESASGEKSGNQVLLTADGRQMEPNDLIGNYSVGTDDKPLFVFYRSYLSTKEPPTLPSRLPQKGSLHKQLEILRQRPSPSLFQHQVALSKHLCEYCVQLDSLCGVLAQEYSLQLRGWKTVLSNSGNLIGMFQKHHQLFQKSVDKFRENKAHNLDLLREFPEQVKLLQKLPMPSSPSKSTTALSLYDWISTHDEKNSLLDLSLECKKALARVDGEQLEKALQSSQDIKVLSGEVLDSEEHGLEVAGEQIQVQCEELQKIMETVTGLSKNIQVTSDKALRSGDAKTIAVLVESHHKSLQLMANSSSQLEAIARGAEESRRELTLHIHRKMKKVMELQKKVAECNGQLVLLHEHMKLAHRRFEILEQVSSTPQVMVEVCAEVSRRRAYNTALEKVMEKTISCLHRARQEEKRLRKSFHSSSGNHFVTTLFPELQDRVPDITFHSPKSLTKSHDDNLEAICSLLPQDTRTSSQLATSLLLLTEPFPGDSKQVPSLDTTQLGVASETSPGDSWKLAERDVESPYPSTAATAWSQSSGQVEADSGDSNTETLKELVGKLELAKMEFSSKLQECQHEKAALQADLEGRETTYLERLRGSEELVAALQQKIADLEASRASSEKERTLSDLREKDLKSNVIECAEKLSQTSRNLQEFRQLCTQLTGERDAAKSEADSLRNRIKVLQLDHTHSLCELEKECSRLQAELARTGELRHKDVQEVQRMLSKAELEREELKAAKVELLKENTRLLELQESWKMQRQGLVDEVAKCREGQTVEKEALSKHSSVLKELNAAKEQLETALERCRGELKLKKLEQQKAAEAVRTVREEKEKAVAELEMEKRKQHEVGVELRRAKEEKELQLEMERKVHQETEEELRREKEKAVLEQQEAEKEVKILKEREKALENKAMEAVKELEIVKKELEAVKEELGRQQQRSQQAQATMNTHRAQLEALDAKKKAFAAELDEKTAAEKQLQVDLEVMRRLLDEKETELAALKAKHAAELSKLEERLLSESGKTGEAEKRNQELENNLNQKTDLEEKLSSAKARIKELEADVSRKKEKLLSAEARLQQTEQELESNRAQLIALRSEKTAQKDGHEHQMQEMRAKLEKTIREHEEERNGYARQIKELEGGGDWVVEKDGYIKQVMELEREVKELRRNAGQHSPPSLSSSSASPSPRKQVIHRMPSVLEPAGSSKPSHSSASLDVLKQAVVQLHSFQVGQLALFLCDQYGNYLALSVDRKTYYLDGDSTHHLQDLASTMPQLNLKRKLLVGRITSRLYMEVRKENNRLKVPVGSRLYKLQAEAVAF